MARNNQPTAPAAAPAGRGRGNAAAPAETQAKTASAALTPPVPAKEPLYIWERISGKHHLRTPAGIVTIKPGDTVQAPRDAYSRDSSWKFVGPVTPSEVAVPTKFELRKETTEEEGFFNVFKTGEETPLNSAPLTEEEADELVNASLEA